MARGVLSGFITGGVVSTAVVALVSVLNGPAKAPDVSSTAPVVENAATSAADQTAPNQVPASDERATATQDAPVVTAPEPETAVQIPEAETPPVRAPEASTTVGDLSDPENAADEGSVEVGAVEPVYPNPQARAPEAPGIDTTAGISEETVTPPATTEPVDVTPELDSASVPTAPTGADVTTPEAPAIVAEATTAQDTPSALSEPEKPTAPVVSSEPAAPIEPEPEAEPQPEQAVVAEDQAPTKDDETVADAVAPEPETPSEKPEASESDGTGDADTEETPQTAQDTTEDATAGAMAVATDRVRIGKPAKSLLDREESDEEEISEDVTQTEEVEPAVETATAEPTTEPALAQFAVEFDNSERRPLMSIVLMDGGEALSEGPIGLEALQSFPYKLSFAVDASLPDAAERAEAYRARGLEVLALIDLPANLTAADTEVALSAALASVPGSVAVLEGAGEGLQGSKDMSDQVSEILKDTGHGIIWQPKGLDTAQKLAAREGVASETLFRDFDNNNQTPRTIRRFLDQAAFKAGQNGSVVMVGRVRPDTISALVVWGLQDRATRVAVAPVSAVLQETLDAQ